jgi:hypothetical protein
MLPSDEDTELAIGILCIIFILFLLIQGFIYSRYINYINKNSKNKQKLSSINSYKSVKHVIFKTKTQVKPLNKINRRNFSTLSRKTFIATLSCRSQSEELTRFIKDKNLNPPFIYEDL